MTTRIDEIAANLYRISTPTDAIPGGFTFNQYLLVDEEPLLFHTGMRALFPGVRAAIGKVMAFDRLRWVAFGHAEADECGALAEVLQAAPQARPLAGTVQAMLGLGDLGLADRAPKVLADGETHALGRHVVRWIDAPHVPHAWDNGFLFEETDHLLFGGDLFTQPGTDGPPVTEGDILGPSEAMRKAMDYWSHGPATRPTLDKLAALEARVLACMHGSAYRGDVGKLLGALADALR